MIRKKTRNDAKDGEAMATVEEGMLIVSVAEDIAHMGTIVSASKTKGGAGKIVWRCDYVVMRKTREVRELGAATEMLKDRLAPLPPWYAGDGEDDEGAGAAAGVLISTIIRQGTLGAQSVISEEGAPFVILVARTKKSACEIFPQGSRVNIARYFHCYDLLMAGHGRPTAREEEKKKDEEGAPPMHARVSSASPNTGFPLFDLLSNLGRR